MPLDNTGGLSLNFTEVQTSLGPSVWYGFMFSAAATATLNNATLALEEDANDAPALTLALWSVDDNGNPAAVLASQTYDSTLVGAWVAVGVHEGGGGGGGGGPSSRATICTVAC